MSLMLLAELIPGLFLSFFQQTCKHYLCSLLQWRLISVSAHDCLCGLRLHSATS